MVDSIYHRQLFDSINDAAVYVDSEKRILNWNRAAERMTGQSGSDVIHQVWSAEMMGLRDELGRLWEMQDCPLDEAETKRRPLMRHLDLFHREGHVFKIKLHVLPVINSSQDYCGAILLVQDASTQVSLEERVQTLYERMTRDPLTGVSNREQLDRRLQEFVPERLESGAPGCLIMCDIDHFKRINDNFGHQAGDDALVSFAKLLRELSRSSDMVARYGGEEFVVMCRDCDLNSAVERAQEIRRAVENQPMPSLRGSVMTASFGVTQVQPGDTGESLLARADRALLIAKETGRNRVIQLSAGQAEMLEAEPPSTWFGWFRKRRRNTWIVEHEYIIPLPDDVAIEKLSGFIHDHKATIVKIEANDATLRLDCYQNSGTRRNADRPANMFVQVQWHKVRLVGRYGIEQTKTWLKISVGAERASDRRLAALMELANHVLRNLVVYLGAEELDEQTRKRIREGEAMLTQSEETDEPSA
jgi:diguanylate cyclase (GGDEF)-like protein/PAS domain S-box-containing protein